MFLWLIIIIDLLRDEFRHIQRETKETDLKLSTHQ